VLTAAMAAKYFGDENPIGKTLTLDNQDYQITGVMQDVPRQSHFHPDFLAAMATFQTAATKAGSATIFTRTSSCPPMRRRKNLKPSSQRWSKIC
jgi:hypothetical protein